MSWRAFPCVLRRPKGYRFALARLNRIEILVALRITRGLAAFRTKRDTLSLSKRIIESLNVACFSSFFLVRVPLLIKNQRGRIRFSYCVMYL